MRATKTARRRRPTCRAKSADPLAAVLATAANDEATDARVRAWLTRLLGTEPPPARPCAKRQKRKRPQK